jgi:phosphoglucosamine mutase
MTNQGLADYMQEHGKALLRTSVGDCHILEELRNQNLTLGGEPSGHIIARDFSESSDGLFTALRLLETIMLTNNVELTTFKKYPQAIVNVPITTKKDLENELFKHFIDEQSKIVTKSRIMIRYSGTEPVVRILVEYNNIEDSELVRTHLIPQLTHYFV